MISTIFIIGSCLSGLSGGQDIGGVLEVKGRYYYEKTDQFINKTFQVIYHGMGQGMPNNWRLTPHSWGRVTAGAGVRLGGLGEFVLGKECWPNLCLNSAISSEYYLYSAPDTRVHWNAPYSRPTDKHEYRIYCDGIPFESSSQCQIVSRRNHTNDLLLRVYDVFVVWCKLSTCWYNDVNSHWSFKLAVL